jgi:conjugal transfer ATP-binding protein TraC
MPLNQRYKSDRCGELLMPLAYEPDSEIFYCADQTIGFGFMCRPLTSGDPKAAERLNVMLKDAWPTDTILQFILLGSQNIQPPLFHMRQLRAGQEDPLLLETVEQRAKFLTAGVNDPVEKRSGLRVRDIQLLVTVKLPLSGNEPTQAELDRASEQKVTVQKSLESVGLAPIPLTSQAWLDVMVPLINQGKDASWRLDGTSEIETDKLLRDQVFDYQTDLKVNAKGLSLGEGSLCAQEASGMAMIESSSAAVTFLIDPLQHGANPPTGAGYAQPGEFHNAAFLRAVERHPKPSSFGRIAVRRPRLRLHRRGSGRT